MNKTITAFMLAAAMSVSSVSYAASTSPELLPGLPTDYEVLGGAIPRNKTTGELGRTNNANGYIFIEMRYKIVNGKLIPQYPVQTSSGFTQADLDRAKAEGRSEGIAAAKTALAGIR